MLRLIFALSFLLLMATAASAQATYGAGELPNRPPRIDEKSKTTAIVLEVYPTNSLIKVKDEITHAVTTYHVATNADITGDKKEFGKKTISLKEIPKGRRVRLIYYSNAPSILQEIVVLKPDSKK